MELHSAGIAIAGATGIAADAGADNRVNDPLRVDAADDGEVLVDGAVLNNFPVDIMRQTHRGYIIGSDVARAPEGLKADDFVKAPGFFGWVLKNGFSEAPPIASLLMRTATLSVNPNAGRELADMVILPDLEETDLRDWENYEAVVEAGYVKTKDAIARAGGPLARYLRT